MPKASLFALWSRCARGQGISCVFTRLQPRPRLALRVRCRAIFWKFVATPSGVLRALLATRGDSEVPTCGHNASGTRAIDGKSVERVCLKTGQVLERYSSLRGAAQSGDFNRATIKEICDRNRRDPQHGGFSWRYNGDASKPWPVQEQANRKAVEQLCLETGAVLASYPSISSAEKAMQPALSDGISRGSGSYISAVCLSKQRVAHGYFWQYSGSSSSAPRPKAKASKCVERLSLETGRVLSRYSSSQKALQKMGLPQSAYQSLCRSCRDEAERHGYKWRYAYAHARAAEGGESETSGASSEE